MRCVPRRIWRISPSLREAQADLVIAAVAVAVALHRPIEIEINPAIGLDAGVAVINEPPAADRPARQAGWPAAICKAASPASHRHGVRYRPYPYRYKGLLSFPTARSPSPGHQKSVLQGRHRLGFQLPLYALWVDRYAQGRAQGSPRAVDIVPGGIS